MKIPRYQAQVSPTNEAPGQQFRTRYNPNLAANAELAKGKPLSTALTEIGEFARVRYELARDNLLNEVTLATDEKMSEAFKEMSESRDFNRVLDGDNPLWSQKMTTLKSELKNTLGKDKYSNAKFDAYFGQSELRSKLKLRGVIDQKVKQAAIEYRNMQHQSYVDTYGVVNGDINEAQKGLQLLTVGNQTLANKKINGQPYVGSLDKMSKQTKAALYLSAKKSLEAKVFDGENVLPTSIAENILQSVMNNDTEADDSYTSKLLKLVKETHGPIEALKLIYSVARMGEAFEKLEQRSEVLEAKKFKEYDKELESANKLSKKVEADFYKAQVNEVKSGLNDLDFQMENWGDISKLGPEIEKTKIELEALSTKAFELDQTELGRKIEKSLEGLKIVEDQATLGKEWNETMSFKEKSELMGVINSGKSIDDIFGIETNFDSIDTKTNEGLAVAEYLQGLWEKELENLGKSKNDLTGWGLDNIDRSENKNKPENLNLELLLGQSDDASKSEITKLVNFARQVHQDTNIRADQTADINYLPKELADQLNNQVFAQSSDMGDLGVLQALFEHFEPHGIYDDVLRQLGKDEALFVVGDLIRNGSNDDARKVMAGLRTLKNNSNLVVGDLKKTDSFIAPFREVMDLSDSAMAQTAELYAKAAQAWLITESNLGEKYVLPPDAEDSEKNDMAVQFQKDAENVLQVVLGQNDIGSDNPAGGMQNVFSEEIKTLVPDFFTKSDLLLYMNRFDPMKDANLLDGQIIDENVLKDIRAGENIKIMPVAAPNTDKNLYLVLHEQPDGRFLHVPVLDDLKLDTGKLLQIDFDNKKIRKFQELEAIDIAKDLEFTLKQSLFGTSKTFTSFDEYKKQKQVSFEKAIRSNVGMLLYKMGIESDLIQSFGSLETWQNPDVAWVDLPDDKKREYEWLWNKHKGQFKGNAKLAWDIFRNDFVPWFKETMTEPGLPGGFGRPRN
tara:strand:- start:636 stop:3515 length:2880 start_codon:yes stop_codon:yes gene_type:complete